MPLAWNGRYCTEGSHAWVQMTQAMHGCVRGQALSCNLAAIELAGHECAGLRALYSALSRYGTTIMLMLPTVLNSDSKGKSDRVRVHVVFAAFAVDLHAASLYIWTTSDNTSGLKVAQLKPVDASGSSTSTSAKR
ncbi:hypothetical protein HAX54_027292, partial [Datura stramonium]|nr:hypothetical protein [Datura stramonium]